MSGNLLDPEERQQLEQIASTEVGELLRCRARILLLYDEGQSTRQVAQAVGRSRGRVRYWRRQYRARGLKIFPLDQEAARAAARAATRISLAKEGKFMSPEATILPDPTSESPPPPQEESLVTASPAPAANEFTQATPEASPSPVAPAKKTRPPLSARIPSTAELLESLGSIKSPGVQPDDTLTEAGRKVLRFHFTEMLRHEAGTRLGDDIEELHDMRVATRRMRAAFEIFGAAFKPKAVKTHLKGMRLTGRALGRARDLDVFMEKAGHYLETLPEGQRQGLEPLLNSWELERVAAREGMATYLDGQDYLDFKYKFYRFVTSPGAGAVKISQEFPTPSQVRDTAPTLIYSRLGAVRAYVPLLSGASLEQLHALRIEFKKLRYTVEFFREVLGEEAKPVINDLKGLQDHLGDLNDSQVATQILSEFLAEWDVRQANLPISQRQNPQPVVGYLAYQHAERHRLMTTFTEAWACFDRPEFRRNLALAISVL